MVYWSVLAVYMKKDLDSWLSKKHTEYTCPKVHIQYIGHYMVL